MRLTGKSMRAFRLRIGWSQARLAEELGLAANSVARAERGEMKMSATVQKLLARIMAEQEKEQHDGSQKARQ
jgi:transcriptional regulator with XRE-family HTH domain